MSEVFRGIVYGDGTFLAVGDSGLIAVSGSGLNWDVRTSSVTVDLLGVGYGNSTYVVVGKDGKILTGSDGVEWVVRSSGVRNDLTGAAYYNLEFVEVGTDVILNSTCEIQQASAQTKSFVGVQGPRGAGSLLTMLSIWQNDGKQIPPESRVLHIGPPCQGAAGGKESNLIDNSLKMVYNDGMEAFSRQEDVFVDRESPHGPNRGDYFGNTAAALSGSRPAAAGLINTYYIYSFDGKLMAEYDHDGICVKDYIYVGNKLLAEYHPQTNTYYYFMNDQINSTRIITDDSGNVVYSAAHGPYGDVQKTWANTYEPKLKFSGKEREGYSDLDYFGGRYYDHQSFRFNSVDPVINKDEALVNPQLWNLYAYCRNNPITYFDPDGRKVWLAARRLTKAYVGPLFVHSYILIMPNNPKDFKGKTKWAISGYPEKDNLHLDPDNGFDRDFSIKELKGLYEINAPEGKSDTQFIRDIIKSKDRYKDRSRKFSKIPNIDKGEGNCNSLATSVLVGAGVPLEDIKKIDPFGYNPGLGEVFPEMIRKERK